MPQWPRGRCDGRALRPPAAPRYGRGARSCRERWRLALETRGRRRDRCRNIARRLRILSAGNAGGRMESERLLRPARARHRSVQLGWCRPPLRRGPLSCSRGLHRAGGGPVRAHRRVLRAADRPGAHPGLRERLPAAAACLCLSRWVRARRRLSRNDGLSTGRRSQRLRSAALTHPEGPAAHVQLRLSLGLSPTPIGAIFWRSSSTATEHALRSLGDANRVEPR